MINQQLREYVSRKLSEAKTKEEIKASLLTVGWKEADIEEALSLDILQAETLSERKGQSQANNKEPELKAEMHHKAPLKAFLFGVLSFLIGVAVTFTAFLFLNKPSEQGEVQKPTGFKVQQENDGKRIADVLSIQVVLEKYYDKHNNYPSSLDDLKADLPVTPSGSKYNYVPIGSPAEAYTLNAQVEGADSQSMVIDGGFLTLKNIQGQK